MPNFSAMISQPSDPTLKAEAGYNVADTLEPMTLLSNIMGLMGNIGNGKTKQMTYTVGNTGQPVQMQQMPSQDLTAFLQAFRGQ